ncbi:11814_t:CDS:1, partial [Funneliformis caledonium]
MKKLIITTEEAEKGCSNDNQIEAINQKELYNNNEAVNQKELCNNNDKTED